MRRQHDRRKKRVRFEVAEDNHESMASWLQQQASSRNAQLAITALLSGAAVAGTIFGIQALRRQIAVEGLKASIPQTDDREGADGVGSFRAGYPHVCRGLTSSSEADALWRRIQSVGA